MKIIDGGICSVKGVRSYGIKSGKMGLAVIVGEGNAAGVFTRNKVIAAPLVVTREVLQKNGKLAAIIANSGNANAFTGEEGLADASAVGREPRLVDAEGLLEQRLAAETDTALEKALELLGGKVEGHHHHHHH